MSGKDVVFVGGSQRSGTSLLQAVLCSSPDAHPRPSECQYLTRLVATYARWRQRGDRFVTDYFGDMPGFDAFTRRMVNDFLDVARATLAPGRVMILKHPELTALFPPLAALLPEAKFVVSIRDPRDIVASLLAVGERFEQAGNKAVGFPAGRDMRRLAAHIRSYYAPISRAVMDRTLRLGQRVRFVRYEDMIRDTDAVLRGLESFTGLSLAGFDRNAAWRNLEGADSEASHALRQPWRTEFHGRGMSADSIGRWAEVLSLEEARQIEQHCRDMLERWRYPIDSEPPLNT